MTPQNVFRLMRSLFETGEKCRKNFLTRLKPEFFKNRKKRALSNYDRAAESLKKAWVEHNL